MEKLFLLDVYALVYRSYYAFIKKPRINSKGQNTSAIVGFLNTLHEVLTREKPAYLAVALDHGPSFRHALYPAYKAQREAQPEDITRAMPLLRQCLAALRIPCLQVAGYEADDIIATVACHAAQQGVAAYMLTLDKDFGQVVADNIFVYRPRHAGGYDTLDAAAVCAKYDIASPRQIVDLLALMGDTADNYPGCPGVGEKTAAQLIRQYGSVDALLAHSGELQGKLRERIEGNVDSILLAKRLATICTDVPIDTSLAALRVQAADEQALRALFAELEFRTIAKKFLATPVVETPATAAAAAPDLFSAPPERPAAAAVPVPSGSAADPVATYSDDLFAAAEAGGETPLLLSPEACHAVSSVDEVQHVCALLSSRQAIALHLYTDRPSPIEARLMGVALAATADEAYYIPLSADAATAQATLRPLASLLADSRHTTIGHNLKYSIEVLRRYGIALSSPLFDTMVAHYLLQPELRHSLDYLAETLLHVSLCPLPVPHDSTAPPANDDICAAACQRVVALLRLQVLLHPQLATAAAADLFCHVEMPLVPVLADMEYRGVRLDTAALRDTSALFTRRMQQIEEEVHRLAGHTFNISSPRQVGDVLFGELQIAAKPKKTKTGQYVTNEEELQKVSAKHPIVAQILAYRGLKKLIGTYIDALPLLVNPRTQHIHTTFHQTTTATGRLSSSEPNLQNIPVRDDDGKAIRRCFIPEEGCLFLSADYSQIELRILAHLSGDDEMIHLFHDGRDIHASTAARIFKKPLCDVSREERSKAKRANFGIIYGITTWGLAESLAIAREEAQQLIDDYFAAFPRVREYIDEAKASARHTGYAETLFHRRRYLPDILSANATVRAFAERNAINAPIQGTAADIIKIAMTRIYQRFQQDDIRSAMLLSVHDELTFSVYPDEKERVEEIVRREMQHACTLRVPLIVEIGWGSNWLAAH